jgi:hypothetical protein
MKRLIFLVLILVSSLALHAAAPTWAAVDAVYEFFVDTTIAPGDTIAGASDSTILLTKYDVENGWQYLLYRGDFSGGGSDSVKVRVEVNNLNSAGTVLYKTNVDSFTALAGEVIDLSVGGLNYGDKITIKLYAYTDNGGVVINPSYYLVKRRPYVWERRK